MSPADFNKKKHKTNSIIDSNLLVLAQRVSKIEDAWFALTSERFTITSGLRSEGQQAELIKAGKTNATKSKHLFGAAADIYDPEGKIKAWLRENPKLLIDAQLWCEAAESTPGWLHCQIIPPASGRCWFIP